MMKLGTQIGTADSFDQFQTGDTGHPDIGHYNIRTFIQNRVIGVHAVCARADQPDIIFSPSR